MSLVPSFDDFFLPNRRPLNLFDQHFGLGLINDDLWHPHHSMIGPIRSGYYRPWRHMPTRRSGMSNIKHDKENFKVNLDVQQFTPEEITVKTVNDFVVIEGKHEEKQDEHGYVSRNFQRRYKLPTECDPETVKSTLSSDGVLTITAPKKLEPLPAATERVVAITQTNAPALKQTAEGQEKMEQ